MRAFPWQHVKGSSRFCKELGRDIKVELETFRDSFDREVRKDLREIKASLAFNNKAYEGMREQLKIALSEIKQVRTENARLVSRSDELTKQAKANQSRIPQMEQYSRNANIKIKGLPTCLNENLTTMLGKIGQAVGEEITNDDIEVCHRVPVAGSMVNKNVICATVCAPEKA